MFGSEAMDQGALNDFIATNAPPSVRALRFSPPPKHDQFGRLIRSSDTEDSPTPEPAGQPGVVGGSSAAVTIGFAGDDDNEMGNRVDIDRVSASHSSETKPVIPPASSSAERVDYGFAGDDDESDDDEDYQVHQQLTAGRSVPAPVPASQTVPQGFAGPDDSDDEAMPPADVQGHHHPAGPAATELPPSAVTAALGFAGDDEDEDDEPVALTTPAPSTSTAAGPPAPVRSDTVSYGFAGDDDDDEDDLYFPHLASTSMPPAVGAAVATSAAAEPFGHPTSWAEVRYSFAGDSDDEDEPDLAGLGTAPNESHYTAGGHVATTEDSSARSMAKQPVPVAAENRPQVHGSSSGVCPSSVDLIQPCNPEEAREPAAKSSTSDVIDEEQRGRTVGLAGDAVASDPAVGAAREPTGLGCTAVSAIERAAPAAEALDPSTATSPPPARKTVPSRPSPDEEDSARPGRSVEPATGAVVEPAASMAPEPSPRASSSPADSRRKTAGRARREPSRDQSEDTTHEQVQPSNKRKRVTDAGDNEADDDRSANSLTRLKIRRKGDAHASETSPVHAGPSPGASGGSDSRGSASAVKAADPFNDGRVRTNVTNGYVQCNAEALRMKNLSQVLTEGEKVSWPNEGSFCVFAGSSGVEEEKIKYLWSIGRYGNPVRGTDKFDEIMEPLTGTLDVWIAPPPAENKTRIDKSAKAQLAEYYALQLVLSGYAKLRQADSPRNSVKVVFVHVSKLGELGSLQGAFAQLEHLRCRGGTRFFAYGRGANMKRACFQFWRSGKPPIPRRQRPRRRLLADASRPG